ncbi:MAG TPA: triose-phosphate isomerase family protein [Acidimicrobiales bacterium]|nr:triose-phosphate isomerase family protein [Acidimicrobiales bacterium]
MKYFLSSWKMYPTVDEARDLFEAVQAGLRERAEAGRALPEVIVCPPFVSLVPLRAVADDRLVRLGAQNCHWEQEGAYTGEISPRMLAGLVDYVMLGHSERRAAGETDDQIARKVAAVVEAGLVPMLFVGEDDRGEDAIRLTEHRLRQGLSRIDVEGQHVVVVYEPTWAVGAQHAASPDHVRRAVEHLAGVLVELGTSRPEIIYGGSVNEDNVDALAQLGVLDGVGATRASLRPESFLQLVDWVAAAS